MSSPAPEAHYHLPPEVIESAQDYVDGLDSLASIVPVPTPEVGDVTKAAFKVVSSPETSGYEAIEDLPPDERPIASLLAKTALFYGGVENLSQAAHNTELPADARRIALLAARGLIAKRGHRRKQPITRFAYGG